MIRNAEVICRAILIERVIAKLRRSLSSQLKTRQAQEDLEMLTQPSS